MKVVITYEGEAASIQGCVLAMAIAAGWRSDSEKTQLEFAAGLINAFVRDVTITNLRLLSNQTSEELESINNAADSIAFKFAVEE